jgi:hypothetical protein
MPEYVTKPLKRTELLQLTQAFSEAAKLDEEGPLMLSYGWDCNLEVDHMWKPFEVNPLNVVQELLNAETMGVLTVGQGDVFIETRAARLQLCHESDAHIQGSGALFEDQLRLWKALGYEPKLTAQDEVKFGPKNSTGQGSSAA